MKRVIILLAGIILSLQLSGQFTLQGKISDENGKPLLGANIVIENTFTGTVSGLEGIYVINKIQSGEITIRVTYVGFETGEKTIDLRSDENLDFVLKHSTVLGEEVLIKGVRAGETDPVAFTTIRKEEIDEKNIGRDIPYLLALTPSMVTTSDAGAGVGYTGFRIRGTDANRINITVNGIALNDAESHGVWFVNMPDFAASVDNIQIQRGVGTSTNGAAAFGASLNFQTTTLNSKPYGELNNSIGSYNTLKNSVSFGTGLLNEKFTFDVRLSGLHSDGYIDRATSDLKSWFVSGAWHSAKSLLKMNVFSGNEKTYQAWDGVPGYLLDSLRTYNGIGKFTDENGKTRYYNNETDNYNQSHYQLHYSHQISNSVNVSGALHFTRGLGYYEQYREDQSLEEYKIPEIILNQDTIDASDLIRRKYLDNYYYGTIFSLSVVKERFDLIIGGGLNRYDGGHYGKVIWARNAGNSEIGHKWYENNSTKFDYNAYIRLNYRLGQVNLYSDLQTRGIKYNLEGFDDDQRMISGDHSFLFFNPKFGINHRINDHHRSFFSFSVANREPNRDNFIDAPLNMPAPQPETLYDYELGYEMKYNSIRAGLNAYFMDYEKQLVLTGEINDVGSPVMTNVKDSHRAGIEFMISSKLSRILLWDFNITLSSNKIKDFRAYVDNWDYWSDPENLEMQVSEEIGVTDIAFSPGIVAGNVISIKPFRNFEMTLQSKYVGKQFIDNTSSDVRALDPWFVNDLSLEYIINTKKYGTVSLNLLAANIFNEEYESNAWIYRYILDGEEKRYDGYFPQAGINFLAGVKIRF